MVKCVGVEIQLHVVIIKTYGCVIDIFIGRAISLKIMLSRDVNNM